MAMLRAPLAFSERATTPASFRSSGVPKRSALPPPARTKRFAFSAAGRCRTEISSDLPLNSPDPYKSSIRSSPIEGCWPSKPITTRASTSSSGNGPLKVAIFIKFFSLSSHGGPRFGFHLPRALGLALVVQFFASGDRQFTLNAAFLEVHFCRDERQALFPRLAQELVNLLAVEQQFTAPCWFVVFAVPVGVVADMGVHQPGFVADHFGEAILELDLAALGRLHFSPREDKSGFVPLD